MIFVTVGTHPGSFERLIRHIDALAPSLKEEVVIQRGFTPYIPKNCTSFDFVDDLSPYYKKARLVISHSATTVLEFILSQKKPLITVPRLAKFNEHLNDHQAEFALFLQERVGIKAILNVRDITVALLRSYKTVPHVNTENLSQLRSFFTRLFTHDA